jgi:lysozyme
MGVDVTFDRGALRAELERDEGRRNRLYPDSVGKLTIGVGWNIEDNGLPDEIIDRLLDIAIDRAVRTLDALEPRWRELDDDRRRVLLNMAYNLGPLQLAKFHRFRQAIADWIEHQEPEALERGAREMLNSRWAKQVGDRAIRLADRWRGRPAPSGAEGV